MKFTLTKISNISLKQLSSMAEKTGLFGFFGFFLTIVLLNVFCSVCNTFLSKSPEFQICTTLLRPFVGIITLLKNTNREFECALRLTEKWNYK